MQSRLSLNMKFSYLSFPCAGITAKTSIFILHKISLAVVLTSAYNMYGFFCLSSYSIDEFLDTQVRTLLQPVFSKDVSYICNTVRCFCHILHSILGAFLLAF